MKYLKIAVSCVLVILVGALLLASSVIESHFNRVARPGPYRVSVPVEQLHHRLIIADLHADSLLWGRNLLSRSTRGHVDIPRMQEGNVAIQAFTVVTKVPKHLNIDRNSAKTDEIRRLAIVERWPPRTWNSPLQRALYQAERLRGFAQKSGGEFNLLRTQKDVFDFLERRKGNSKLTSGFLGIEGSQALEGDLNNLDRPTTLVTAWFHLRTSLTRRSADLRPASRRVA